ncbi:LacI family DNA-binding transcriptional regulator [Amycolatopsis taiwanensis]|uniref:LacI family transcriptional regulator n=1 Tax=Amycolatopsis taiwanensis TaxID=342230 RepID=A0A9W6R1B0_9PSEU|nr:LacI family DNA-binding transcriptional regulator [Amycolatopsis taiwanensis]GLY65725.1 LacI family transcriptional regulator [Amycolatopsis taiwanensis]
MTDSPTLEEVARLAGVSRATASRAINGGARVSARAQRAVEDAIRRLGYTPNTAARSLVTRRTDSVALVVPEPDELVFSDPFFARTLHVVTNVLSARDLQVVLLIARPDDDKQRMLRYLRGRHIDGAIVVSHHAGDALPDHIAALGLPNAFIGRPWTKEDQVSYVSTDNTDGARQATQLLIDRGCRRIGTIAGPADMTVGRDRLEGWRQTVNEAGLSDEAVVRGDFTEAGGAEACEALLDAHPDLDGLVVASDLMASGSLRVLAARGRRVPDDIAVTGYDDLGIAEHTNPPLTTLRNPISEMADQAAQLLIEQLEGDSVPPRRVNFAPTLIRRQSA